MLVDVLVHMCAGLWGEHCLCLCVHLALYFSYFSHVYFGNSSVECSVCRACAVGLQDLVHVHVQAVASTRAGVCVDVVVFLLFSEHVRAAT